MGDPVGLWMYCVIENSGEMTWDCLGIHGTSPVYTVKGREFAAVVSEEPAKKYPLVRDFLIAHQKVNETVMQTHRVLPVKFCTIAEDGERIIKEVLKPKAEEFRTSLKRISNKDEYGLRVRWKDLDRVFQEIGESEEQIQQKKEQILALPESRRRNELIDIGHLVQEAIQKKNEATARGLMDGLSPLASEAKQNNVLGDAMILNAAFLVEQGEQEAFDQKVELLTSQYEEVLQFKYVGPVPPFNFVEIVIRWKEEPFVKTAEVKNVSVG